MRSGDRGEVEMISRYSHDVLLNPDGVSRSPRLPPTKLLNLTARFLINDLTEQVITLRSAG